MAAKKGGTTGAHHPTRAEIVQKSRETRGQVNIGFTRRYRDSLREIASHDGKTLISLLDEISERYIAAWNAKQERRRARSASANGDGITALASASATSRRSRQ